MKCPECIQLGQTSRVYPEGGTTTLMSCQPYYDEDGKLHLHDTNIKKYGYSCSKGHRWVERAPKALCPTCGSNW